jgi:pimeloyl-ACP methyl ester carboxylesterase
MTILIIVARLAFVAYLFFAGILYFKQHSLLYFPTPKIPHDFDDMIFSNQGEDLNIIVINKGNQKALLYFGGNSETVAENADRFSETFSDHTVYLVNYRGYGGSTGTPGEKENYDDAEAIYDFLQKQHSDISVMGRSLGSGVATYLASIKNVEKLVLITPYDSIQSVAQARFPIHPMSILLKDKYNSALKAKDVKAETLILIAENDETIKLERTHSLIKAFAKSQTAKIKPIISKTIKGAGHNTILESDRYYRLMRDFL